MMKNSASRVLFFVSLIAVLVITIGSSAYGEEARGVTKDSLKIGAIVDLTGPISNAGVLIVKAYKNFIASVNDKGGIQGKKVKLIIEDDRYSIPAGIAAFKKLVFKDQVLVIMGPISIGEVKVLFRHIAKNKIPTLPWAPDESVVNPYKRYVFPTNGFYDNEWGVIFDYLVNELKPENPKVALCYPDVESGKVVKGSAEQWAEFYDLKLHTEIIPINAIDVTSQVLSMKRAKVTHILIHHVAPGAAAVLRGSKKFGLDVPLLGTSASCTEDIIRIGGQTTQGYVGVSPYSSWQEDTPGMARVREISMKFNPADEQSYKIKSYMIGWVIPEILFEGMRRITDGLNGESLVSALETIKDLDTQGICGPITYTPTKHHGLNYSKLFKAYPARGELVPISDWRLAPVRK